MYSGPINKPFIILIAIFAIPLAVRDFCDYGYIMYMRQFPLVAGTVMVRQKIDRYGIPAGKLTLRVDQTGVGVFAITNKAEITDMPNQVTFHHSGSPGEEVFIEGEENPIWSALLIVGMLIVLVVIRQTLHGRPSMEMLVE